MEGEDGDAGRLYFGLQRPYVACDRRNAGNVPDREDGGNTVEVFARGAYVLLTERELPVTGLVGASAAATLDGTKDIVHFLN